MGLAGVMAIVAMFGLTGVVTASYFPRNHHYATDQTPHATIVKERPLVVPDVLNSWQNPTVKTAAHWARPMETKRSEIEGGKASPVGATITIVQSPPFTANQTEHARQKSHLHIAQTRRRMEGQQKEDIERRGKEATTTAIPVLATIVIEQQPTSNLHQAGEPMERKQQVDTSRIRYQREEQLRRQYRWEVKRGMEGRPSVDEKQKASPVGATIIISQLSTPTHYSMRTHQSPDEQPIASQTRQRINEQTERMERSGQRERINAIPVLATINIVPSPTATQHQAKKSVGRQQQQPDSNQIHYKTEQELKRQQQWYKNKTNPVLTRSEEQGERQNTSPIRATIKIEQPPPDTRYHVKEHLRQRGRWDPIKTRQRMQEQHAKKIKISGTEENKSASPVLATINIVQQPTANPHQSEEPTERKQQVDMRKILYEVEEQQRRQHQWEEMKSRRETEEIQNEGENQNAIPVGATITIVQEPPSSVHQSGGQLNNQRQPHVDKVHQRIQGRQRQFNGKKKMEMKITQSESEKRNASQNDATVSIVKSTPLAEFKVEQCLRYQKPSRSEIYQQRKGRQ